MGKNIQHLDSSLSLENHHPGCMWGLVHHLHHHWWHPVKGMLPAKRHGGGRHAAVIGDAGSTTTATKVSETQEQIDVEQDKSPIEETTIEPICATKHSMRSQCRALSSEDMSKRKGRHRRSSSCPTRMLLLRTNSINHLDPPIELAFSDETLEVVNQDNQNSAAACTLDPPLPKASEEPFINNKACALCAAMLTMNAEEPTKNVSLESKLFLSSVDLLNMRKELFLKILEDPNSSPLVHHLLRQWTFNSKRGLTKSLSFPTSGLPGKRGLRPSNHKYKQGIGSCAEEEERQQIGDRDKEFADFKSVEDTSNYSVPSTSDCGEDGTGKQFLTKPESSDISSPGSPRKLKTWHENKLVHKHFKILRKKIKHVIRESRKERRPIIMDSVFHKIPYGRKFLQDKENAVGLHKESGKEKCSICSSGSSCKSDHSVSALSKDGQRYIRRTSSVNEALDRYSQLFESSFNKEAKHHISERLRSRTEDTPSLVGSAAKSLGRILSLPDIRCYTYFRGEESPDASSADTPVRSSANTVFKVGSSRFGEQKPRDLPSASESQTCVDDPAESGGHDNLAEIREILDDSGNFVIGESASGHELEVEPIAMPTAELAYPSPNLDPNFQENTAIPVKFPISEDLGTVPEHLFSNVADSATIEQHDVHIDSSKVTECGAEVERTGTPVDVKDKAEFNYVRDVLELSGFTRDELLGTWYSTDQPLDPLVFEEVEGCLLAHPDCLWNEEGGQWDHLLLFDLINEVLLEIYEKSFTYYPMPLTGRHHIHRMPVGYHVLEEVWASISWYLSWRPDADQSLDDAVRRDLAKGDGWMNLQCDAECVGLELEDLIFDDLLEELVWGRLLLVSSGSLPDF